MLFCLTIGGSSMDKKPWYERFKKENVFDPAKFTYLNQEEARILNEMTPLEFLKGEKIFSKVLSYVVYALSLLFIVLALVFSFTSSKNFNLLGGYGYLGLIFIVLALLVWAGFGFLTERYHTSYQKDDDAKKELPHLLSYFILIPLIITCYFLVPLRSQVLSQYHISHSSSAYDGYLAYVMIGIVWGVSIALAIPTILLKNKSIIKKISFAFMTLSLYIPLFFMPVLQTTYSITYPGSYLVIFAPIVLDIGLVVSLFSKTKRLTHTAYHVIADIAILMEFIAIVNYGMNVASAVVA